MLDDKNTSVYERINVGIYADDKQYLEKHNLSASQIVRDNIKQHKQKDKTTSNKQRIDYVREKMIIVFIGVIGLMLGNFESIPFPYNLLFYIAGLIFIFYAIFSLAMKFFKTFYGQGLK